MRELIDQQLNKDVHRELGIYRGRIDRIQKEKDRWDKIHDVLRRAFGTLIVLSIVIGSVLLATHAPYGYTLTVLSSLLLWLLASAAVSVLSASVWANLEKDEADYIRHATHAIEYRTRETSRLAVSIRQHADGLDDIIRRVIAECSSEDGLVIDLDKAQKSFGTMLEQLAGYFDELTTYEYRKDVVCAEAYTLLDTIKESVEIVSLEIKNPDTISSFDRDGVEGAMEKLREIRRKLLDGVSSLNSVIQENAADKIWSQLN
jgi:hypothetical protein